ncbi:MAG TPA: ATP-binding protein [Chthoniobacterales bacterium]|jgi:signal transduction histidine kinase
MKFLGLAPLIGAICNLLLSVFIIAQDPRSKTNRVFFAWGLCISVWNVGTFMLFRTSSAEAALTWARFLQFGVIFIPVTLLHLSLLVAQVHPGRWLIGCYLFQAGLAALNCTDLFISGVRYVGYAWYSVAGPGFWAFVATFSLTTVSIIVLIRRRRTLAPLQQRRLNGLILAQTLLVVLGTNDILPILAVDEYPFIGAKIYPYGSIAAIFYGIIVGYSVLQHQLLNIRVTLGHFAAHLVRFLFLLLIGLALQLTLVVVAPGQYNSFSFVGSLAVLLISTLVASLLFPRLMGDKAEGLERRLLGDHFEYQDQARSFIDSMSWYTDLNLLFDDLNDLLTGTFRLSCYQIILRDEASLAFTLFRAHPSTPQQHIPELRQQSPILQYFEWNKAEYLVLQLGYSRPGDASVEKLARDQLAFSSMELCFPLSSENQPFGLLLVGPKNDGKPFTATDINLLVALVKNMSLMVNQIRLKNQILQAQELDLLGRMSRGMAHDLNNLLTPVWTLLQLSIESGSGSFDDELLPVALRNVKTMRAYIKEALFFSENLRPDLQLGRLDLITRQAADLARASRSKTIAIEVHSAGEVLAEVDEVLVQRLIANLISNAIDASPENGRVDVQLERLSKTETSRDWLRIRVIDHGEGIAKENLSRILTPYFTTKNRGDENRGFGLGLAICRKIVNLHGGNLTVSSQLRKGTTVQVDLPSRQVKTATPPIAASTS